MSIVKKKDDNVSEEEWKYVTYLVFDAPKFDGAFEERIKHCHELIKPEKYVTRKSIGKFIS